MVNWWEETTVDREASDRVATQTAPTIILGYQGLGEILARIKAGQATYEERARVLVLAEEIEDEGNELTLLAIQLRALAGGGKHAVDMVGGGTLPGGRVHGVVV